MKKKLTTILTLLALIAGAQFIMAPQSSLIGQTYRILVRRGLATNLPTLAAGEFGFTTDTRNLYIGSSVGNIRVHGDYITPEMYGAKGDGTTNDTTALQNAITAAQTNRKKLLLTETYLFTAKLSITSRIEMCGPGDIAESSGNTPSAYLIKDSTYNGTGIEITANGTSLRGFLLTGEVGNGGDGIVINAHGVSLEDVSVNDQGNDGIRIGADAGINSNGWVFKRVYAANNGRYGCYVHDGGGPDANAGAWLGGAVRDNTSDGLRINGGLLNVFTGLLAADNGGYGVNCLAASQMNSFIGCDLDESNVSGAVVDAGTKNTWLGGSNGVISAYTAELYETPTYRSVKLGHALDVPVYVTADWYNTGTAGAIGFRAHGATAANRWVQIGTIATGTGVFTPVLKVAGDGSGLVSNLVGSFDIPTGQTYKINNSSVVNQNVTTTGDPTFNSLIVSTNEGLPGSSSNAMARPAVGATRITGEIYGYHSGVPTGDDGFMRLSAGAGTTAGLKTFVDLSGYSTVADMDGTIAFGTYGTEWLRIDKVGAVTQTTGTAPTTSPTNGYKQYSADAGGVAGMAGPHFRTEAGGIFGIASEAGTTLQYVYQNDSIADDASVLLPDATSGMVLVSCNAEAGMWLIQNDGTVTKISGSTNTAAADTDANLCVYDAGTAARVKNRLGATGEIRIVFFYN